MNSPSTASTPGLSIPAMGSETLPSLLPCPFCGGAPRLEWGEAQGENIASGTLFYAALICENQITCSCSVVSYLNNQTDAVNCVHGTWNRRFYIAPDMGGFTPEDLAAMDAGTFEEDESQNT